MARFVVALTTVILWLTLVVPTHAQQANPPAAIPSCNYVKDPRGYSYCNAGQSAAVPVPQGGAVTYSVGYPADGPTIFITAQISPFDPSANSAVGINVYDTESGAKPRVTGTMAANSLSGRQNTFQVVYQTGQGSPLTIQLFNYWSKPVTFALDHSGLMYGDTYAPNALQLTSPALAANAPAAQAGASAQPAPAPQSGACQFVLGFQALHDLDSGDIGDCQDNQGFAPNGDAQQHTTRGLMAWRKADNWTAFTNGYQTWINGPQGLQKRLNTERFPWEAPAPATSAPLPTQPAPAGAGTFGDGTLLVGKEISAGTYRTRVPNPGCYWARLSGFSGQLGDIIANNNTDAPAIVTIGTGDKGFQSTRCGTWTTDLSPITGSPTALFGDGTYFVNKEIAPGTWRSQGTPGCYYARLSGFGGASVSEIIANGNSDTPVIITIGAGDAGFTSTRCGTWTKIG